MLSPEASTDAVYAASKVHTSLTSFVGRRHELAATKERLTRSPLVTDQVG